MSETIRLLSAIEDLRRCEEIERRVWGLDDREVLSGTHMRAALHAGGMAAGAFVGDELAGFVFGFHSAPHGAVDAGSGLHSHLLAVLPSFRGRRLGIRLKWFQRRWCLDHGLGWMSWTFDPLQLGNARLNLEHLGATSDRYLEDFYGRFGGSLSGRVSTDRLLIHWQLDTEGVGALAAGGGRPPPALERAERVLERRPDNEPDRPVLDARAPLLLLELPAGFTAMIASAPERAERWRAAVRTAMTHYFALGYRAARVVGDAYLLERVRASDEPDRGDSLHNESET